MTSSLLPLEAEKDNIIVAGFSSGSFMAAQLQIAFPQMFQCAGMFNGGLPGASLRFDEYLKTNGMEAGKELDELKEQQWKLSR